MVKNSSKEAIFVRVGLDLKKPFFVLLKIIMLHLSGSTERSVKHQMLGRLRYYKLKMSLCFENVAF